MRNLSYAQTSARTAGKGSAALMGTGHVATMILTVAWNGLSPAALLINRAQTDSAQRQ